MSIIKNVVDTSFTSKGASATAAATDGVTKAQTRLGQSSASAGRQFSAQASGLGGLVAAYAGAAATIFALEAAYMALSKAAEAETIVKGTNALARTIGQSGPTIIKSLQTISQGQLTLAETAQNANIALSAGFNTTQIEKLSKIALGASRALGRDFQDALQRVTRGAAKLEPELLDELGIFTRIDPAVRAYASSLNVSATSLTQFERRQAFVNAVIDEGNKKFSSIDTSSDSLQKSLEQLRVTISDLGKDFLLIVGKLLLPFVDFFNNNAGNALLLFGGVLSLVFGKSLQIISNFAKNGLNNLSTLSSGFASRAEKIKGSFQIITDASKKFNKEVSGRGGLLGGKGGTGGFAAGLSKDESQAAALARRNFQAGGAQVGSMRKADIAALTVAQTKLAAAGRTSSLAYRDATKILTAYSVAAKSATVATRLFSGAATVASLAARGLGFAMTALNAALGVIFTVITVAQLAGTFFDIDILTKIKEGILGIKEASEDLRSGFLATAGGSVGEDLVNRFKELGASSEELSDLSSKLLELRDSTKSITELQLSDARQALAPEITDPAARANIQATIDAISVLGTATNELAIRQQALADTDTSNESRIRDLSKEIALYKALIETLTSATNGFELLIGQTARLAGIPANAIADLFGSEAILRGIQMVNGELDVLGNKFSKGTDFNLLSEGQQRLILDAVRLRDALDTARDGFNSAALDSEKLSARLAGANTALQALKNNTLSSTEALDELAKEVQTLNADLRALQTAEKTLAGIQKNFSAAISGVDTAPFQGLISITGKLATNAEQINANQAEYLRGIIEEGYLTDEIVNKNSEQLKIVEAGTVAQKAQLGLILRNLQKTIELRKESEKRVEILKRELDILQQQNRVAVSTAASRNSASQASRAQEISKIELEGLNSSLAASKVEFSNQVSAAKFLTKKKEIELEIGLIQSNNNRAAQLASLAAAKNANKILQSELELAALRRNPGATRGDVFEKQRSNILLQRKVLQDNFEKQRAAILAQGSNAKAELDAQRQLVDLRKKDIDLEITNRQKLLTEQLAIFDKETANTEAKIQADIQAAERAERLIIVQEQLDLARINAARAATNDAFANTEAQLKGMAVFAETTDAFNNGIKVFAEAIAQLLGVAGDGAAKAAIQRTAQDIPQTSTNEITSTIDAIRTQQDLQTDIYNEQKSNIETIANLNRQQNQATISHLYKVLGITRDNRAIERDTLEKTAAADIKQLERAKELLDLELKKAQAQADAGGADRTLELLELQVKLDGALQQLTGTMAELVYETDYWNQALNATKEVIGSSVTQALVDLNASFYNTAEDTRTFGEKIQDSFANIFKSIQETFFEKTIAKPIGDFVMDAVSPLFGNLANQGIDNVVLENGAVPVTMRMGGDLKQNPVEELKDKAGGFFSTVWERIKSGFSSVFGEGGFLPNLANTVFGQGGIIAQGIQGLGNLGSSVFSGLGNILSSVFNSSGSDSGIFGSVLSGIGSIFTGGAAPMASGGIVKHMSQGGGVNGLRDSVPALLEPGEFVMRKQAAKSIGTPSLQAMNAGGSSGGNVVVNIKNEGTPQEATASQPKFDGEKFVIDIVTRDLANNGPIRRSMRAGS